MFFSLRVESKTGPAVEPYILMRLVPAVEKFARTKTFLIGDRIGPPLMVALCVGESGIGPTLPSAESAGHGSYLGISCRH